MSQSRGNEKKKKKKKKKKQQQQKTKKKKTDWTMTKLTPHMKSLTHKERRAAKNEPP